MSDNAIHPQPSDITVVATSCDRQDLLKITLDSFLTHADQQPDQTILIEDSPAPIPAWLTQNRTHYENHLGKITWLQNASRLGQIRSIDRAYSQVTTNYIFHLEDDWQFLSGNFLTESRELLDQHSDVIMVSLRGNTGWHPLNWRRGIWIAEPGWHEGWGGISFNPGLRRTADYKKIGAYSQHTGDKPDGLANEIELSRKFLQMGYVVADLNRPIIEHIGQNRSRANAMLGTRR
jgi:hypothetical protein